MAIEGEEVHRAALLLDGLPHDREQLGAAAHAGGRFAGLAQPLDPEPAGRGGEGPRALPADLAGKAPGPLPHQEDVRRALPDPPCARARIEGAPTSPPPARWLRDPAP